MNSGAEPMSPFVLHGTIPSCQTHIWLFRIRWVKQLQKIRCNAAELHLTHCFNCAQRFVLVAGLVAEKYFGFNGSVSQAEVDIERDHANARALGNSLLVCLLVPWALCLVSYTGNVTCTVIFDKSMVGIQLDNRSAMHCSCCILKRIVAGPKDQSL